MRAFTHNGEQPDAIGWRDGLSIMIECKASRSDFLADKNKDVRKRPERGMGDWRFYLCPPEIIYPSELPLGWGLLYALPKQIRKVHGMPKGNCNWWHQKPFEGNKRCETQVMYAALRRIERRGLLDLVYEKLGMD
jgi:hypothetical protein